MITGETAVALVGALSGGFFVKLLDAHYRLKEKKFDAGTSLRGELHQEISALKADSRLLQTELDTWKTKYYGLFERNALLKARHKGLQIRISDLTGEEPEAEIDESEHNGNGQSQVAVTPQKQ